MWGLLLSALLGLLPVTILQLASHVLSDGAAERKNHNVYLHIGYTYKYKSVTQLQQFDWFIDLIHLHIICMHVKIIFFKKMTHLEYAVQGIFCDDSEVGK